MGTQAVSVAEQDEDEPDDDYCAIHAGYLRPCRVCRMEQMEFRAECEREE